MSRAWTKRLRAGIASAALAIACFASAPPTGAQTLDVDSVELAAEAEAEAARREPGSLADAVAEAVDAEAEEEAAATEPRPEARAAKPLPLSDAVARALAPATEPATRLTNWVVATGDNGGLPFIVIDKVAAAVMVFDPNGEFLGETPALLGIAEGDDSTPGIGEREFSEMGPEERTTPAGRFAAQFGAAVGGHDVLWVDYATSVALHPVVTGNRRERRVQRLRSPEPEDNRITFGCINVPAAFYSGLIRPLFADGGGIVYILPEVRPIEDVFPSLALRSTARGKPTRLN